MGAQAQGVAWPDALVARLVAGGRQVIRYDHRDTGESDSVDFDARPYTIADLAADALAVLDGHGVDSAHVVGASMGGIIGQWLAVHRPDRVRTLTLMMTTAIDGVPGRDLPPPAPAALAALNAAGEIPDAVEREVAVLEALHGGVLPFDRAAARDLATRTLARARNWAASGNHHRLGRDGRPTSPAAITAPTLVLAGTADPIFPPGHPEALAGLVPHARLVPVDGMGHGLLSPGLPERVADLILEQSAG
jgi:pimeloyl-ACP methyl ester carboxylesterase